MKEAAIARLLDAVEVTLPALAQDGSIQPRTELVIPGRINDRLALSGRFLLEDRQRTAVLDRLWPALSTPTAAMLLDTFSEDPGNVSSLHSRLQRLLRITEPNDDERLRLAKLPIIPVQNQLLPPSALAFTGTRGDYWGKWKFRLPGKGLSQDDQHRYRAAGVTSSLPDPETSRTFLEWLASQDQAVLQHHIPCVLRHILHKDGPASWAESFTDTPFIPVKGRDGLRLVSLRMARCRSVYLPDAGDMADVITHKDPAVLLVIQSVKDVPEPISESLRKLGIKSLREALGEPGNVAGTGKVVSASYDIFAKFRELQSPTYRRTFLKRLDALEVESALVRYDWHNRLGRVRDICLADEVEARYRFHGMSYAVEADAGFDPGSGIFWMKRHHRIGVRHFYESIAAQLVFRPSARRIDLTALERSLEVEIYDPPTFGRPTDPGSGPNDGNSAVGGTSQDHDQDDGVEAGPGEAVFGHSPFEPDPKRNAPEPGPISSRSRRTPRRSGYRNGAPGSSEDHSYSTPTPELEKEHIETLKLEHYASHCQMCLCEKSPRVLAPEGSYIQWEEVRRRVVEAHHVDLKSAGGARHAGNLILLCKLHHDNYGRRLTGAAVTAALRGNTREREIRFGVGSKVKGQQIELVISDTGEGVELFFTDDHADFWLSHRRTPD